MWLAIYTELFTLISCFLFFFLSKNETWFSSFQYEAIENPAQTFSGLKLFLDEVTCNFTKYGPPITNIF